MTWARIHEELPRLYYPFKRTIVVISTSIILLIIFNMLAFKRREPTGASLSYFTHRDSVESGNAFLKVYSVLMSPRCMNCHPAGDVPLQGDDSRLHLQGVRRGVDGTGLYALKCTNCHQAHNLPGLHMPPGNPKWRLPSADMKMVFQGRSPRELAVQLLDKKTNGGKSLRALIDHITSDTLVLSGWTPADGLSAPPLSHKEFVRAFSDWINHGAVSP